MIRVLLVDDSALMRQVLRHLIEGSGDIAVAGEASNGLTGCELNLELAPDLIIMDLDMPVLDGVAATVRVMKERPVPILVFSAKAESPLGFAALEAGASDLLLKPDIDAIDDEAFRKVFHERLRCLARHAPQARVAAPARLAGTMNEAARRDIRAVVIGASTGGPLAVREILSALPAGFPVGIALVQHLEDGFDEGYVRWLGELTPLRVRLAVSGGLALEPGTVTVAPVSHHLVVKGGSLCLDDGPRIGNQKPAVDALFGSAAAWFGSGLVGVLLTGMGRDGADGCAAIRASGGTTLVQDQQTSAIFGMPKAAIESGAASEVLPLQAIASRLVALVSGRQGP